MGMGLSFIVLAPASGVPRGSDPRRQLQQRSPPPRLRRRCLLEPQAVAPLERPRRAAMASGRCHLARRTGVVPGGNGRYYREVWPAKSGVAVVLPAPNRLTMSYTYIHIYQEEAEERRKPHPKMG